MDNYIRRADVLRIVDGDTFEIRVDLGYRTYSRFMVRIRGFDAPELNTPEGVLAQAKAHTILNAARVVHVRSYKDQQSFSRWIADVFVDGVDFVQCMNG